MKDTKFNLIATTVFGLESVVKDECIKLGFKDISVSNGKVEFTGDMRDIVRANLWLRSSERVLIKIAQFNAVTFDDIYDNISEIPWEKYLSENGKYIVTGKSVKSKLYSISDNQSISKKAIIDRMSKKFNKSWFDESGERYHIDVAILKNLVTVTLDTSGNGLHKRGYRQKQNEAPMKETLAAALVQISNWNGERPLVDLFCGSGTILIEACLIAKNIAPGISRDFDFNKWDWFDKNIYKEEKTNAYKAIKDKKLDIKGFDIDKNSIEIAKLNAINAGVDEDIEFVAKDMSKVGLLNNFGVLISNPPYGERIGNQSEIMKIYRSIGKLLDKLTTWSFFIITADKEFEESVNRLAIKKRKLYNGRIEVDYYQYPGPDPMGLF